MIAFLFDYASPSALRSSRDRDHLDLAADGAAGVRFYGRVRDQVFLLRTVLRALGEAIWSDDTWMSREWFSILDPIVTVHPDFVFLEAFSQDQSAYVLVELSRDLFETEGEVRCGTANVDFSSWLWSALGEMRSSRETWLRLDSAGLSVDTAGAGGRFERTVELPEEWLRGFLQLQAAMALPGTRLRPRPVDLLSALRFLRYSKARMSPRALRYEFEPGQEVRLVLEPWEEVFPLRGTEHSFERDKKVRLWGRRRLRLLEPLLPFAEGLEVYLKGRAMPSFYSVEFPGMRFLLGLSGWTGSRWNQTGLELLAPEQAAEGRDEALAELRTKYRLKAEGRLAFDLCRQGLAFYDLRQRELRHRELFKKPVDLERIHPPDPRAQAAREHLAAGRVELRSTHVRETRKVKKLWTPRGKEEHEIVLRDHCLEGSVADQPEVEVVVGQNESIIFGRCGCTLFREHLLSRGPCEHMLALRAAASAQ